MKKSQLKFLIKEIVKSIRLFENIASRSDLDIGTMKAVNVEESQWEEPEEKLYSNMSQWAKDNLEKDGTYKGEPLHNYGFIYKVGELIPLIKYHLLNAMHLWNTAKKKKNENLRFGKPLGMDEESGTGAIGGYQTPFAFSKNKSGSQRAIDATKKLGYKVVGSTPRV